MRIYVAGIGGTGLTSLAELAQDCGYNVVGSELESSRNTDKLTQRGITVLIGQSGKEIEKEHSREPIDWFIGTSALPSDHPELAFALKSSIKVTKRDELINHILKTKQLKLIAVSGTHGKTTTTAMLIWLFKELDQPVSYSIGTNLGFGPSGQYQDGSKYFIYEADEFDRNFLAFKPYVSIIPSLEYDHSDTYPTQIAYDSAFMKFVSQSHCTYTWTEVARQLQLDQNACLHIFDDNEKLIKQISLLGHNRLNGFLALQVAKDVTETKEHLLLIALNKFPGSERRMEKLAKNLYSDYAHHPSEIASTLALAAEEYKNIVVLYQPHQNLRQHQLQGKYGDAFKLAKKVYWLPTYLSREDPKLGVLTPEEIVNGIRDTSRIEISEMNDELTGKIKQHLSSGDTVLILGAGSIDGWARSNLV